MSVMWRYLQISVFVLTSVKSSPMIWTGGPLQECPNIKPVTHLKLEQLSGTWRVAYLFLDQTNEGLDEDFSCVVLDLLPSLNSSEINMALFIDTARQDYIERSSAAFSGFLTNPSDWKIHAPLSKSGSIHARVIHANDEDMVITFCSADHPQQFLTDDRSEEVFGKAKHYPDEQKNSAEQGFKWKNIFDDYQRAKRSTKEESHLWTAVLVKHNNVSALKFVEYASILMKHGFDVTKGELISFGKCPAVVKKSIEF